ncbi:hypothetical protein NC651_022371 [Populus alba x Populus x berolinensis]|nr:hypothetical protein NC651_022371 [Populus alba x Populus x berolinensis]
MHLRPTEYDLYLTEKSIEHEEAASKHSATVLAAASSAWSFLLTAMEGWRLSEEHWQGHVKLLYFADIPINGFQHEGASHEFNSFQDSNTKPSRPNLTSGVMLVKANLNGIPFLGLAESV